MAITRTQDVDDDLTGTTGTIRNNAWKQELYDQIDAALAALGAVSTEQTTTATGAQHNFNLTASNTYLRCTGAAPSFSGFTVGGVAPEAGDRVLIQCLGTTAKVTNQDTGSTAANRIITPATIGQIIGLHGLMLLTYDDTTDRWRESIQDPGLPIAITFAAGDFTASGTMTWTVASGDVVHDVYVQNGKLVKFYGTYNVTTVGGSLSNELRRALPNGFVATREMWAPEFIAFDNNAQVTSSLSVAAAGTLIRIRKPAGANWAAATDATYIYVSGFEFEVD